MNHEQFSFHSLLVDIALCPRGTVTSRADNGTRYGAIAVKVQYKDRRYCDRHRPVANNQ
jgi:hypothetical protein